MQQQGSCQDGDGRLPAGVVDPTFHDRHRAKQYGDCENGDAIADLAEDNFLEMRDKVADPVFQEKRKLELRLEQAFPEYYSKYSMVTFRPDLSYYTAMVRGRQQDAFLMDVCKTGPIPETDAQLQELYRKLQEMIKRTGE